MHIHTEGFAHSNRVRPQNRGHSACATVDGRNSGLELAGSNSARAHVSRCGCALVFTFSPPCPLHPSPSLPHRPADSFVCVCTCLDVARSGVHRTHTHTPAISIKMSVDGDAAATVAAAHTFVLSDASVFRHASAPPLLRASMSGALCLGRCALCIAIGHNLS